MKADGPGEVEARTQELGHKLYGVLQEHHPSAVERVQDRLMVLLMRDPGLRTRFLRFVDVLAAIPKDRAGQQTASLFREYFQGDLHGLPVPLRLGIAAARSPITPPALLRWSMVRATHVIASRFIVQPGPDSVGRAIQRLAASSRYPTFDLLGEAVLGEAEAQEYKRGYLRLLEELGRRPEARERTDGAAPCLEVSLKLSSLTSQFNPADPEGTLRHVRPSLEEICLAARDRGIGITVDAEQYACRELGWYIFRSVTAPGEILGQWPDVGLVLQSYLKDGVELAREVLDFAQRRGIPLRVRLVKGAYWDYEVILAEQNGWPVPVYRDKSATDRAFEDSLLTLLGGSPLVRLAVGSHNVRAHAYAEAARESLNLPEGAVEHQTLYRTLEALSSALPRMGWSARDYVPLGELIPGMAYLVRRILENTSQVGFLTKTRLHEDVAALLTRPQPGSENLSYSRPAHTTGFVNTPMARLFAGAERSWFEQALRDTRSQWGREYPLELGSEHVKTGLLVPSISPSHSDPSAPVGWVHHGREEDVERAIALATQALAAWAGRPIAERSAIGLRSAEILRKRRDEVAAWVVHEGGRTWLEALADVEEAIDQINWNAHQVRRMAQMLEASYCPRGVVACIPPWNFPTALPASMVSAALMAGNTVILKSAGPTPIVAQMLTDTLHQAGVPGEALIHLPGPGERVGMRLVQSPDVDMVTFTGSMAVGTRLYGMAASVVLRRGGIKRVIAEMGGKNAIVVLPDADMDEAVSGILTSAFGHAGQKCSACSRVLAHRQVYDVLVRRLMEAARSLPVGPADDPATVINPVISKEALERILAYRQVAYQEGRVLLDMMEHREEGSLCLGPLIVEVDAGKSQAARLTQEEIFGPILALIPFESEEEAVRIVNNTVYALTLGIFSRSPGTVRRMVRACRAGNVYVNREVTGARVGIEPFGGFQLSGTGPKAGGEEYVMAFMAQKRGFRDGTEEARDRPAGGAGDTIPPTWRSWEETPIEVRVQRLSSAAEHLAQEQPALDEAIASGKAELLQQATAESNRLLETVSRLLAAAAEVAEPQPTVAIPGQDNFVTWSIPRGLGVVAVDEGSDPASLAALVFAPLLAGNGVLVVVPQGLEPVARLLVETLWREGVPRHVLCLAQPEASVEGLVAGPVHFAAVDLSLERSRSLYKALAATDEGTRPRWLKALISLSDGPNPGEAGFLRQFAHPKTVAVRTVRHGAELKLF